MATCTDHPQLSPLLVELQFIVGWARDSSLATHHPLRLFFCCCCSLFVLEQTLSLSKPLPDEYKRNKITRKTARFFLQANNDISLRRIPVVYATCCDQSLNIRKGTSVDCKYVIIISNVVLLLCVYIYFFYKLNWGSNVKLNYIFFKKICVFRVWLWVNKIHY